jgi:hypothetical protein
MTENGDSKDHGDSKEGTLAEPGALSALARLLRPRWSVFLWQGETAFGLSYI